jgi:hypothetical protein
MGIENDSCRRPVVSPNAKRTTTFAKPNLGRGTNDDTTTRAMHAAQTEMVDDTACDTEMRARKRKRDLAAQAGVAIPGLPFDVAVSLVENHLPDPADLAVLRAVSHGMRAAVDATGRKIEGFEEDEAARRGYLSTLKCLRRRGVLNNERLLCTAAARNGDLEELKALRIAENVPWDVLTCHYAALGGHLSVGFRV